MKKVVSFDVFDTCIIRTTGSPDVVFELLAKNFVENGIYADILDFIKERKDGEYRARINSNREEVSIEEIYEWCDFSFATKVSKQLILAKELDIEESVLLPVLSIKKRIDYYRNKGYDICFISDMYLPESFIRMVLEKFDMFKFGDRIYVSSTYNATKSRGKLYKYFKKDFPQANFFNWRHHGDNIKSDVFQSLKNGAFPVWISHKYSKQELISLQPFDPYIYSEIQKYTSISRAIRLSQSIDSRFAFAVDVVAPMYVAFVVHILKLARDKGLSDLYFFARDGYLFYLIALQFQDEYSDLRFHYIYTSRKAIYYPALAGGVNFESLKTLFSRKTTLCQVLDYLFLSETDLTNDILISLRYETDRDVIIRTLCDNNLILEKIINKHREQQDLFLRYLQQEGVISDHLSSAIVDLRGTRKSHELLNDFLSNNGYNPIFGFYYEVVDDRITPRKNDMYYACIFREQYRKSHLKEAIENFTSVFEQYFSATPHKRTSHYKLDGHNIVPVFEKDSVSSFAEELFEINSSACIKFCQYARHLIYADNAGIVTRMIMSNFLSLLSTYDKNLLRFFDGFVMSENQYDKRVYVKKLSFSDFKNHNHIMWFKGSVVYTFGRLPYYFLKFKEWTKQIIFK